MPMGVEVSKNLPLCYFIKLKSHLRLLMKNNRQVFWRACFVAAFFHVMYYNYDVNSVFVTKYLTFYWFFPKLRTEAARQG